MEEPQMPPDFDYKAACALGAEGRRAVLQDFLATRGWDAADLPRMLWGEFDVADRVERMLRGEEPVTERVLWNLFMIRRTEILRHWEWVPCTDCMDEDDEERLPVGKCPTCRGRGEIRMRRRNVH